MGFHDLACMCIWWALTGGTILLWQFYRAASKYVQRDGSGRQRQKEMIAE